MKPNARLPLLEPPQLVLHADRQYKAIPEVYDLEHVSGEFFLLYTSSLNTNGDFVPTHVAKAEFRLSQAGEVSSLGPAVEREMKEDKIWFKRVM